MKEAPPPKHKPAPPPVHRPAPPAKAEHKLKVRFYRRMKPQRVYALTVEPKTPGGPSAPVIVRPLIPGAHVTPAECALDLARPDARAAFYVTPLARGKMPDARVEVLHHGKVIQEVQLPMKGVTQRLTWLLAGLTVLVPALLLYGARYHKLTGTLERRSTIAAVAGNEGERPPAPNPGPGGPGGMPGGRPNPVIPGGPGARPGGDREQPRGGGIQAPPATKKDSDGEEQADDPPDKQPEPPKPPAGAGAQPPPGPPAMPPPPSGAATEPIQASAGQVLEQEIKKNVPKIPQDFMNEPPSWFPDVTDDVAAGLGTAYDFTCTMVEQDALAFWVGVMLLLLTGWSWVAHWTQRTSRSSKPFALPAGDGQPPLAEGVGVARRVDAPIALEPTD